MFLRHNGRLELPSVGPILITKNNNPYPKLPSYSEKDGGGVGVGVGFGVGGGARSSPPKTQNQPVL